MSTIRDMEQDQTVLSNPHNSFSSHSFIDGDI